MFHLFKSKDEIKIRDVIWVHTDAKWKGIEHLWNKDPETVFVFWFEETMDDARAKMNNDLVSFTLARELNHHHLDGKPVVFAEHYPLPQKEQELFQRLQLKEVKILSALDEPLFKRFGADKIVGMLKNMGLNESEPLENQMITGAIKNAQQKLEKQASIDHSATSQRSWLEKNLPSEKNY
jgi:hypothetical protein